MHLTTASPGTAFDDAAASGALRFVGRRAGRLRSRFFFEQPDAEGEPQGKGGAVSLTAQTVYFGEEIIFG